MLKLGVNIDHVATIEKHVIEVVEEHVNRIQVTAALEPREPERTGLPRTCGRRSAAHQNQ